MRSACWMLLLGVACASAPPTEEPEPPPERDPDPVLADVEADRVLAAKYYALALALYDRWELADAREMIYRALALAPDVEEYRSLERNISVQLGDRTATVEMVANEAAARAAVRREEELLTVRRLLAEAERAKELGRWEEAKRAYERALFVIRTSRFREDAAFRKLAAPLEADRKRLPDERAEAERRRRDEALKELAQR